MKDVYKSSFLATYCQYVLFMSGNCSVVDTFCFRIDADYFVGDVSQSLPEDALPA